jgi:DNA-binding transcriptional regulator YiaG
MVRVRRRRKDDLVAARVERPALADEAPPETDRQARKSKGVAANAGRAQQTSRPAPRPKRARYESWDGGRVRALRRHMNYTQQQLSDELGTRQQTVSEWETGVYQPRGASARLLSLVAERAGFSYDESAVPGSGGQRNGQTDD